MQLAEIPNCIQLVKRIAGTPPMHPKIMVASFVTTTRKKKANARLYYSEETLPCICYHQQPNTAKPMSHLRGDHCYQDAWTKEYPPKDLLQQQQGILENFQSIGNITSQDQNIILKPWASGEQSSRSLKSKHLRLRVSLIPRKQPSPSGKNGMLSWSVYSAEGKS